MGRAMLCARQETRDKTILYLESYRVYASRSLSNEERGSQHEKEALVVV